MQMREKTIVDAFTTPCNICN